MTAAPERSRAAGLLLAAGGGRRMGTQKALLGTEDETWLARGVRALHEGGCHSVTVVLGAAYDEAVALVPDGTSVVRARNWEQGMGESLRAGLEHLSDLRDPSAQGAVVTLVDLPDVGPPVVSRVLTAWAGHERPAAALTRAVYAGRPGHPVVIGRDHWGPLLEVVSGDAGAQPYLTRVDVRRSVDIVECADLATGLDVDRPSGSEA
jgi:CTP:molybdopterin cytidylyltransferase MocA